MKKVLILLLMGVFIPAGTVSANITEIFYAFEDAMVDQFGGNLLEDVLSAQGNGAGDTAFSVQRSFLKFNISSIPDNAVITGATFHIYQYQDAWGAGASGSFVGVHYVGDSSWIETGTGAITWDNQPGHGDFINSQQNTVDEGYYHWDLLAPISSSGAWWDSAKQTQDLQDNLLSLMIKAQYEFTDNYAWFYSSEAEVVPDSQYWPDYWPKVVITYTVIPEPSSMILGGLGIGVFGALRRRKTL